ncbi:MFS transporter [Candidatus Peregrinibacteria bacterium]|jgi:MFS family permease|nr:MFS transporter [Candidatus Peregrinibacteria bacterium]MBT4632267.1 MFS transporter [Candidatus Peregrinibacteria bacterium]MBT5824322.1 MFS transporter [Candidatus Peregrinibacteria bacterium]
MTSQGITKAQLQSNIWKFYLFHPIGVAIGMAIPVIVLFWQDNGLSLTQVMILQSLFSIILIAFEVPSGYLADVYGRKKTFTWSAVFILSSVIAYSIGSGFLTFLISESLMAVGLSLLSGADSAFLYDTLKQLGREKEYKQIWGKRIFYGVFLMAILNLLGGWLASYELRYIWYAAIIPTLLMLLMSFTLHEPERSKLIYKKGYLHTLRTIIHEEILNKPKLKWLIIYTGITFSFFHGAFWFYQPIFEITGVEIVYYGAIFAGFNVVSGLVSRYAYRIESFMGKKLTLISLTVLSGLGIILMSRILFLFTFLFILLHQFVRGMYHVVVSDYINELTDSSIRATVLSAQSLFARFFYAMLIPFLGLAADIYSVPQMLFVMGITALVSGGIVLLGLHRYKLV